MARILLAMLGLGVLLLGMWGATYVIDQALLPHSSEQTSKEGNLPAAPTRPFPDELTLTSRDGRQTRALVVNRPKSDRVTIQRARDGRTFFIDFDQLNEETIAELSQFPVSQSSGTLQALIDSFQGHLPEAENTLHFPHRCTLVSVDGIALPVTLLKRKNPDSIQFRRETDREVFTLPLKRLIKSDRDLIRQFPVAGSDE